MDSAMRVAGAGASALPFEGAAQLVEQKHQDVQLPHVHGGENGDGNSFIPVRSRRTRRRQRQQLHQSIEGPYSSPSAEVTSLKTGDVVMDEAASLLQPLAEPDNGCTVQTVAYSSFSNDAAAFFPGVESSVRSLSSTDSGASCLHGESTGARAPGVRFDEVQCGTGIEKKTRENVRAAPAGSSKKIPTTRGEKKPYFYELRRLYVPAHRMTPLRKQWVMLIEPLVTHLQLQVRMNVRRRCVELRKNPNDRLSCSQNIPARLEETSSLLQKGSDYVRAFLLGFAIRDALALLRLDDLSIESFEVRDVKRLGGDHLSRCLARLSGREGKTKFAIENATRTRLVFAGSTIHILGSFDNIRLARHACCSLILGAPPGKVYNHLRTVTRRLAERI